ncbi:MAG: hypothetical protein HQK76_07605 [Desulfobacterales bacterium]|nr:hypothetical protein [Desulfobacterales bacterium]
MDFFQTTDLIKYGSIPIIAAFVGWGTNWLAIKMTLLPLEFIGYRPLKLGWQGLIPARAEKFAKILIERMVLSEKIEFLLDLKTMLSKFLADNKALLNRLFLEIGGPGFSFLIISGLYFGFLFGVLQMAAWYNILPAWWILPAFGIVIGSATNWVAIYFQKRPLHPVKIGPFIIQGIFIKHQESVSESFAAAFAQELFTPKNIANYLLTGPKSYETVMIMKKHIKDAIDMQSISKIATQIALGPSGYAKLKADGVEHTIEKTMELYLEPLSDVKFNRSRAQSLSFMIASRMKELNPQEFEFIMRITKDDEWLLILIGGILGFLSGMAQLYYTFGGSL